jgi:hypothetical protein
VRERERERMIYNTSVFCLTYYIHPKLLLGYRTFVMTLGKPTGTIFVGPTTQAARAAVASSVSCAEKMCSASPSAVMITGIPWSLPSSVPEFVDVNCNSFGCTWMFLGV